MNIYEQIFGKNIEWYRKEIKDALECKGKYKHDSGLFHPNIVLYIQSEIDDLVNKRFIYDVLEAFIENKESFETSALMIGDPVEVLKLAKKYVDEFDR